VKRVLLTGMSGTGKTTLTEGLVSLGYKAVDLDDAWCERQPDGRLLWREDAVERLLAQEDSEVLFVAGCEANMQMFLPRFDLVVLLTAPADTVLQRIATRTNNPFGKSAEERERLLDDLRDVEPRLRRIADHEVDATASPDEVLTAVLALVAAEPPPA
jgi:dephospho-CoA kinase